MKSKYYTIFLFFLLEYRKLKFVLATTTTNCWIKYHLRVLSRLNFILLESWGLVIIRPLISHPHCSRLANCSVILLEEFGGSAARRPGARPRVLLGFWFVLLGCCWRLWSCYCCFLWYCFVPLSDASGRHFLQVLVFGRGMWAWCLSSDLQNRCSAITAKFDPNLLRSGTS